MKTKPRKPISLADVYALKLAGVSNSEIAAKMDMVEQTFQKRIKSEPALSATIDAAKNGEPYTGADEISPHIAEFIATFTRPVRAASTRSSATQAERQPKPVKGDAHFLDKRAAFIQGFVDEAAQISINDDEKDRIFPSKAYKSAYDAISRRIDASIAAGYLSLTMQRHHYSRDVFMGDYTVQMLDAVLRDRLYRGELMECQIGVFNCYLPASEFADRKEPKFYHAGSCFLRRPEESKAALAKPKSKKAPTGLKYLVESSRATFDLAGEMESTTAPLVIEKSEGPWEAISGKNGNQGPTFEEFYAEQDKKPNEVDRIRQELAEELDQKPVSEPLFVVAAAGLASEKCGNCGTPFCRTVRHGGLNGKYMCSDKCMKEACDRIKAEVVKEVYTPSPNVWPISTDVHSFETTVPLGDGKLTIRGTFNPLDLELAERNILNRLQDVIRDIEGLK